MADENLTQTPETSEKVAPVSMALILDGAAFIKSVSAGESRKPHRAETSKGAVFIREVGHGIANEVIVGQYRRDPQGDAAFDGISTMDRCICMAIQQCVVGEDGEPLWKAANVEMMYNGPQQALFRDFLTEVYDLVIKWNPHLHPAGNASALRRLRPWMA